MEGRVADVRKHVKLIFYQHLWLKKQNKNEQPIRLVSSVNSVSYTHLDVYKRQPRTRARAITLRSRQALTLWLAPEIISIFSVKV